jgi:hypothetical protein
MLASSGIALPRDQVKAHKVRAIVYPWSIYQPFQIMAITKKRITLNFSC